MKHERMADTVTISMRAKVLGSIFDDCDRYDHDETGGRIIGVFHHTPDGSLHINVNGVIDAGPKARRSNSSFFQDGDYQTQIFRQLETAHPEIEHLGIGTLTMSMDTLRLVAVTSRRIDESLIMRNTISTFSMHCLWSLASRSGKTWRDIG